LEVKELTFSKAGKFWLSKSGKSLTVEYLDQWSLFKSKMFLNIKDLEKVLKKDVVHGDVFVVDPSEENESCESHTS